MGMRRGEIQDTVLVLHRNLAERWFKPAFTVCMLAAVWWEGRTLGVAALRDVSEVLGGTWILFLAVFQLLSRPCTPHEGADRLLRAFGVRGRLAGIGGSHPFHRGVPQVRISFEPWWRSALADAFSGGTVVGLLWAGHRFGGEAGAWCATLALAGLFVLWARRKARAQAFLTPQEAADRLLRDHGAAAALERPPLLPAEERTLGGNG